MTTEQHMTFDERIDNLNKTILGMKEDISFLMQKLNNLSKDQLSADRKGIERGIVKKVTKKLRSKFSEIIQERMEKYDAKLEKIEESGEGDDVYRTRISWKIIASSLINKVFSELF